MLRISVPESVYQLEGRLLKVEEKLNNNEIFRQKAQRKGKLSERVKYLNSKIETLAAKSPDIIASNIQNYYHNADEKKEESMKTLFLYEASSNTKGSHQPILGLADEIDLLTTYLQNLNELQLKVKGMGSKKAIVENHQGLLQRRKETAAKIANLSQHMREQYERVVK